MSVPNIIKIASDPIRSDFTALAAEAGMNAILEALAALLSEGGANV